jgi:[acyl-carrier-protein] S-malonyltransferase
LVENKQSAIAFLFPGQGSQYAGMGKDLADKFTVARQVFEEADEALSFSISRLCFEVRRALQLTENTQPAIVTVSIAAFRAMQSEGWQFLLQSPDIVWANTPHWLPRVQ